MYPRVSVEGTPRERGRRYGESARSRVRRSIEAYQEVFAHLTGWDAARVRDEAAAFRAPIAAYGRRYLEEIRGIAEGAGVGELDVLAINVRTEIMSRAAVVQAVGGNRARLECTAFAALPERTGGDLLVGQNWDWLAHAAATTVVLEARQDEGPAYVTVVEAGLLAKAGMNSAGVALATNALLSDGDGRAPGVPYHVLLRAILDCGTVGDAVAALRRAGRAASGSFLLADDRGAVLGVEAGPGGAAQMRVLHPRDGLLLHTNHFREPTPGIRDLSDAAMPDSPPRLARLEGLAAARRGPLDRDFWQEALADHLLMPLGLCCHPDPAATAEADRYATVMALVMDPASRRLWLASGNPCEAPFELVDCGDVLAAPAEASA